MIFSKTDLYKRAKRKITFELRRRQFLRTTGIAPPISVVLEFDYHCPLRCRTCRLWTEEYRSLKSGNRPKFQFEEMKHIIRELASYGVRCIIFLGGEPFLYKELFPLIDYSRSLGLVCSTFTNGYLMDEALVTKIIDSQIESICFSIDGPSSDIHDTIRGREGVFSSAMYGVQLIQRMKRKAGHRYPQLSIQTTVSAPNIESLPDMVDLAKSLGVLGIRFQYLSNVDQKLVDATDRVLGERSVGMHIYGSLPSYLQLNDEQVDKIPAIVQEIKKRADNKINVWIDPVFVEYDKKAIATGTFPRRGCKSLWSSATISAYGDVTPCAMLNDYVMGNVRESSFRYIWSNTKYQSLRNTIRKTLLPICIKCCDKP